MATRTVRLWYIDKLGKMGIVEKATNATTKNGYTTDWISVASVLPVRLYAISRDSDISVNELTNTFNQIPGEYHEALVYKVIAMGYKDPRQMDIKIAQYFDNEYMIAVKQGKKFSKSNYTDVGYVIPQDF
jgi:hypothetical protein